MSAQCSVTPLYKTSSFCRYYYDSQSPVYTRIISSYRLVFNVTKQQQKDPITIYNET